MPGVAKDDEKLNRSLCQPGSRVFYWERAHAWALGRVVSDDGKYFTVKGDGYSSTEVAPLETEKVNDEKIWPANREDVLDEDVTDLLDLTILHDSTIQRCLYIRYMKDMVYTNIGAIVVALNPWNFKIPWYTDDNMHKYLAEGETVKNNVPHSWAQAHNTYNDMKRDGENQTILISGESGAGKTEAAKIVMKYLGAISCMRGEDSMKESAKKVAFNINQASPILEGFGNAKTVRNDNSSRFGKFMKVQFNAEGFLVGAYTIKYLLEKSRIVTANPNERVYHSFYLLLQGKDAGKYELGAPSGYHVNAGNCIDIPGVDDGEDYSIALSAMDHCGFSASDIDGVWSAVAGMLHILQVKFKAIDADSSELDPSTRNLVDTTAKFWQIDGATLAQELQTTTIQTRDGPVVKQLTTVKAADARDAVVKGTYDELFAWQVVKINGLTDSGTGSNWIGLLDIFGFEDFEYNSFEQLCINLANETLQNHYNAFIFTKDMDECRAEGVDVTEVKCPDSTPCLNMMTQRGGIFSQLDDECSLGASGTDEAFLAKVLDVHTSNPFFAIKKGSRNSFIVHHYAASVNYTVENWLEKNRDTLKPDMKLLMRASKHPLIASLIEEPDENVKKMTTGGFFKNQLTELMDVINSTNPHWIRCVKPHPAKKPLMVDGITCMQQLESSGVLGTVKIRKAGFPVRPTYAKFIARFKCIMGSAPAADADASAVKEYCKKVIEHAGIEAMKAQCGKTKVFLKNEANQQLEAVREKALYVHVKRLVQASLSVVSQLAVRKQRWEASSRLVQAEIREWLVRSEAVRAERERERAAVLEAMKAVLAPFNAELDAATDALRSEEQEEWDAIERQSREGLGGMVAAFMSVVTNAEEEGRFELELQEDEEWAQLAAQLNEARISALFHEVEAEEERLRHALEEEWWLGGRRSAGWSGVGDDVTEEVMGAAPTLASIKGLSGALEEYFAKEAVILEEDLGEWSEPYNRNVVLKEEMRRRQLMTRQFVVAHTEARLGEEQLFEYIWREDIKDSEETEYQIIAQAFFEGTRRLIDEPGTLKGMSSEPSCRKLIEKERRDNVRGLHRQWRLLRLQAEEEATRFCAEGQQYFFDRELTTRHMLSIQEAEMRETCYRTLDPILTHVAETNQAREARAKRRTRKIRALHALWLQEADRMEEEKFGASDEEYKRQVVGEIAEHQKRFIAALNSYRDAAAPVTWDAKPDASSPLAAHYAKRKQITDFEEYVARIEAGEDVDLALPEVPMLWDHLQKTGEDLSPLRGRDPYFPATQERVSDAQQYTALLGAGEPGATPQMPTPLPPRESAGAVPYGHGVGPLAPDWDPGAGYATSPAAGLEAGVPFLEQVKANVARVNDAASDAELFLHAMRHADRRVGVQGPLLPPHRHVASPAAAAMPPVSPYASLDHYNREVAAAHAQIPHGNTERLSAFHSHPRI